MNAAEKGKEQVPETRRAPEASRILEQLVSGPEVGAALATELLETKPAVRKKVMQQLLSLAKQGYPGMDPGSLRAFVLTLVADRSGSGPELVDAARLVQRLVTDRDTAASIVAEILLGGMTTSSAEGRERRKSGVSGSPSIPVEALSSGEQSGRIVAAVLELASKRGALGQEFLRSWALLCMPALSPRLSAHRLSQADASLICSIIAPMRSDSVPDELVLLLPFIIRQADSEMATEFAGTEIGKVIAPLLGSGEQAAIATDRPEAPRPAGVELPGPADAQMHSRFVAALRMPARVTILEALLDLFAHDDDAIARSEREIAGLQSAVEQAHRASRQAEQKALEKQEAHLSREMALTAKLSELEEALRESEDERQQLRSDATRWRTEAELRDHTANTQLELERGNSRDQMRSRLARPVRNLRDHVRSLLGRKDPAIRLMAIAFDRLHRTILDLTAESMDERLPQNLLDDSCLDEPDETSH